MDKRDDFLVEIHTEELPPKALLKLAHAFCQKIKESLEKIDLSFAEINFFATPRRLAVLVKQLVPAQAEQMIERKGPAWQAAFDATGKPTPACVGFARSCGVEPKALQHIKTAQGEWVGFLQKLPGKTVAELLPTIIEQAAISLPIPKRMRWGSGETQFVRPIHSIIMLYGANVIEGKILGQAAGRKTRGHRFHAPGWIDIPHANQYVSILKNEGKVIADFAERRKKIQADAEASVKKHLPADAKVYFSSEDFLNEVTGLVEWPVALCGKFADAFLNLPKEVLISSMQDHQRYFPIVDAKNKLLSHFIVISNIESLAPERVIHGNERVLRARLADADFFYTNDKKINLATRVERLQGITFQAKLGSLYDKTQRLIQLAELIASKINANVAATKRAALLAKTDLTTNMVGEFPELQGVMGYYYAHHDGEPNEVVAALREYYLPRFAGDDLPQNGVSEALALADRLDTLVGTFGINQIPTGDKDPYGLRRAALGVLRILIEHKLNVDLKEVIICAVSNYADKLENTETVSQLLNFMQERLRAWYQEQGISADVFASVAAINVTNPADMDARIKAVQAFKKLNEAEGLCVANKRVSNILAKYAEKLQAKTIDQAIFENDAERELANQLENKRQVLKLLYTNRKYDEVLVQLAGLHQPIDDFFNQVMVMTEDKAQRENRILLLTQLRALFLQVADIALLQ